MHIEKTTITLLYLFFFIHSFAQTDKNTVLYKAILEQDSILFNEGFNKCNIAAFQNVVSDDFDFYHDLGGITKSKAEFILEIENGLCKLSYKARRDLDTLSNEVYPLKNNGELYGAIQNGIHRFYALEGNRPAYLTSVAKFTHLWLLEEGEWRLNKSLSYDHKAFEKPIDVKILFKDKVETERWLKEKNIPALGIGYIENGKIAQISVFGELEKGESAPKNTIWNVASLTKPIVTLITLKLVNTGSWDLDEPLYPYWVDPDIKNEDRHRKLTTRHVLSHQTGFPNWRWLDEGSQKKLRFHFDPGTGYQYSGEGFEYLKKALENKFNIPLEKLADSLLFKPLKMNDTRFCWDEKMDGSPFARWHTADGEQYETHKNKVVSAADDLLTSVGDYTRFIMHVLNGAGLSDVLQKEMMTEQVRINASKYWGLGFWIDENINEKGAISLVHGGDDIGVHTIIFMLPDTKQGLVIFTNSDNGTQAFQEVLLHYFGEDGQGIMDVEMKR